MKKRAEETVDGYIRSFPKLIQRKLSDLRKLVRTTAPSAQESISYHMPSYSLDGRLVYFAAFSRHIGFYPGAGAVARFRLRLSQYKSAKGSVQLPIDEPLPLDLIREIVQFRVEENRKKAAAKTRR